MSSSQSNQNQTIANHPQAGQGRPLPKKEGDLFKNLVKHYEGKQYKKAMKQADLILKKFPQHGETLAMKGLTLYYFSTARHEEAHSLVKSGLRNDMRSHVCWHVYGLLHRADRNYGEAIKCYKQALRIDKDNLQILRDLGLLQIQMRDLRGFVITRNSILSLKPTLQPNWLAFMLAKQLVGETEGALQVIDIYLDTLKNGGDSSSIELLERNYAPSELQLYKNGLLVSLGRWEDALAHLKDMEHCIVDRGTYWWNTSTCLFRLERYEDCLSTLNQLWERGMTEDYRLHAAYMCAVLQNKKKKEENDYDACRDWWPDNNSKKKQQQQATSSGAMDTPATTHVLTIDQCQILLDLYQKELLPKHPKSLAMQRIPLTLMLQIVWNNENDNKESSMKVNLSENLDQYMRKRLNKGVPSLAHDLSSLLLIKTKKSSNNEEKEESSRYERACDPVDVVRHSQYQQILQMLNEYLSNLEKHSQLTTTPTSADVAVIIDSQSKQQKEPPSTMFWTWFCRAGWYELAGQYSLALGDLDRCIDHTPTAVDVYELRARVSHKAGSLSQAVESIDKGRSLDLQDRYMNNQTTRYLLWNNDPATALERISLFLSAKEGAAIQTLYDMQCSWYELELAACLARQKQHSKALKQYAAVLSHFDDIHEDQFDFHSYCIRKVTLRAYADVLNWEDMLWNQAYYREAAEGTIRIYLHLHKNPPQQFIEPDYSGMTAAEKKRAKAIVRKQKKAAEKKKAAAAAVAAAAVAAASKKTDVNNIKNNNNNNHNAKKKLHPTEQDMDGEELLKKNALEECKKYSAILSKYAPSYLNTWLLQYDVSIHRGPNKSLMALQALFKARKLARGEQGEHPEVFSRTVDFCSRPILNDQPEVVKQVLQHQIPIILNHATSLSDYVNNQATKSSSSTTSLSMRIAIAQALAKYGDKTTQEAAKFLVQGGVEQVRGVTIEACRMALKTLMDWNVDDSLIREWKALAENQFPLLEEE
eukprot:CAMPEP_0194137774 /NCGR_PEP_ID=MMETSP0152-20130528/7617_1 /TAXON_ID=1049557 /ORGANISM="Thalassiothrix antarctica, Strain L6-D1" /LENGTH=984 /DNA_ID=CAMNT_0038834929 /DNA_START=171 /DNA_END=3125 /DNA_ORIENTATION=+